MTIRNVPIFGTIMVTTFSGALAADPRSSTKGQKVTTHGVGPAVGAGLQTTPTGASTRSDVRQPSEQPTGRSVRRQRYQPNLKREVRFAMRRRLSERPGDSSPDRRTDREEARLPDLTAAHRRCASRSRDASRSCSGTSRARVALRHPPHGTPLAPPSSTRATGHHSQW